MPKTRPEVVARRAENARRVGRRLADARLAAGFSQAQAAAAVDVAQSAIAKAELGIRAVPFTEALELAELYRISPLELDPRTFDTADPKGSAGEGTRSRSTPASRLRSER